MKHASSTGGGTRAAIGPQGDSVEGIAIADGDAAIRLDHGGINARLLANEAKVDFRRVESASRKIQVTFYSPEVKRLFVRYLNGMQLNTYLGDRAHQAAARSENRLHLEA